MLSSICYGTLVKSHILHRISNVNIIMIKKLLATPINFPLSCTKECFVSIMQLCILLLLCGNTTPYGIYCVIQYLVTWENYWPTHKLFAKIPCFTLNLYQKVFATSNVGSHSYADTICPPCTIFFPTIYCQIRL